MYQCATITKIYVKMSLTDFLLLRFSEIGFINIGRQEGAQCLYQIWSSAEYAVLSFKSRYRNLRGEGKES